MTRTLAILSFFALIFVAAAQPARAAQDEERVSRTVPIAPGGTLSLKNFSGRVTVTGTTRTDVAIEAVRRAPRERLARISLDIRSDGGNVVIEANRRSGTGQEEDNNNVVDTAFDIQVPRDASVDLDVFSSPVTLTGVQGKIQLHSFSGDLTLGDVTGAATARTFSGDVHVGWAPTVVNPEASVETFSGSIELRMPAAASASVEFNTFSGRITSDLPLTLASRDRRNTRATLGAGGPNQLKLKTFSGGVTLRQ